ncbi:sensor histidine kinase [Actinoplanes sp. G11-F43]|uniref:sensor histidine kinase n=1 Tax=Actinoplanes sp. G11-F43 TaxID=3424130 RepID=UPI003D32F110
MSRIGLLLPAGRNRQIIEDALTHNNFDIEVVPATEITTASVDVLLAEPRSLLEALAAVDRPDPDCGPADGEHAQRPPIMLLTRAGDRPVLPSTVVDAADEIFTVPAPQRELLDGITRLAGRRRQAREERRLMREHVAYISHELRTPLQSVLAYAQMLHDENLEPEQGELLDGLIRGGQRMLDLVNELLDNSRAEAGHAPHPAVLVDVDESVHSALAMVRPLADQRHLTVTVLMDAEVTPTVRADPAHLHRILINLLSNAIKYNREDGTITITLRGEPDHIELDITDTGAGMSAAELDQIFEPYRRLPGTTASGTGLGLPYARLLAQRMQGTITVSSHLGVGSTFTLTLPRA